MSSKDAGGGGAEVPRGATPTPTQSGAPGIFNVTFAEALQAGGGHSQSGGQKGQRRGTVMARGQKGSVGHWRCAAPPLWRPQQVHT